MPQRLTSKWGCGRASCSFNQSAKHNTSRYPHLLADVRNILILKPFDSFY